MKIGSVNGWVDDNILPGKVGFSAMGVQPLIQDVDLEELAPYLRRIGVHSVGLARTSVTDRGFESLISSCHETLRDIDVSGSAISDISLNQFVICRHLQSISLSRKLLTSDGIHDLASMPTLHVIRVFDARPDDECLDDLERAVGPYVMVRTYKQADSLAN
jgi:hypothetical protein